MENKFTEKEKELLMTAIESDASFKKKKNGQLDRNIKDYDFRSPQKFSKDHVRALEKVFDTFSRSISNYFSAELARNVKITVQGITQIPYQQYINGLPKLPVLSLYKMEPIQGSIMLDISPVFAYKILEMLLGGKGGEQNIPKEFSDLDKRVIIKELSGLSSHFKTAWQEVLEVEPEYEVLQTNVLGNQILAANEPVALIKLDVRYEKEHTYINVCIPYISIEEHLDKLVSNQFFNGKKETITQKDTVKERIKPVEVNINVELGRTKLSLEDFLKLSKGDVIRLDEKITEPSVVYVEDTPCFYARPGVIKKSQGIQIIDIYMKES